MIERAESLTEGAAWKGETPQKCGGVAQLGEHLPCKQGVRSSILLISTKGGRKINETTAAKITEWACSSGG